MIVTWEVITGICGVLGLSGAAGAGVAKVAMKNYVDWPSHREICTQKRLEAENKIDTIADKQQEIFGMIKEIHGYIKAKNGTGL
jgi:hypothetical protein